MTPAAAKTKRIPLDPEPRIKSLTEADDALRQMAELQHTIFAEEAKLNEALNAVRAEFDPTLTAAAEQRKALERDLIHYAQVNASTLFADKQSVDLTYGEINARKSPPHVDLTRTKTGFDRIAELKSRFAKALQDIVIRVTESVNKEDILKHASTLDGKKRQQFEDQLTLCSITIVRDEVTYGIKLKHDAAIAKSTEDAA
jgi:phage host-nuclease inhibitor protein Gam